MNTDQLAYEVFVVDPGSYFEMCGESRSEAEHYVFNAIDIKTVERRLDGYFEPKDEHRPLHFVEVMFHKKENVYANLFAKVFLRLEQDPARDWRAVIFFESKNMLPSAEAPYDSLIQSERVKRIFLKTLPESSASGFGLTILKMVTKSRPDIIRDANMLVKRLDREVRHPATHSKLLELLEFVVISRLADLSKEEVRTMLKLNDYRESRFYKEARQDGIAEGEARGEAKGEAKGKAEMLRQNVLNMAQNGCDAQQISRLLSVDLKVVRRILKSKAS